VAAAISRWSFLFVKFTVFSVDRDGGMDVHRASGRRTLVFRRGEQGGSAEKAFSCPGAADRIPLGFKDRGAAGVAAPARSKSPHGCPGGEPASGKDGRLGTGQGAKRAPSEGGRVGREARSKRGRGCLEREARCECQTTPRAVQRHE